MSPLWRKRDGSVAYVIRNPDGSWFEMPTPDDSPLTPSAPVITPSSATPSPRGSVSQFLREIASRGGKARAARHNRAELAAWGRVRRKIKPDAEPTH
jgi:hypothetical protein